MFSYTTTVLPNSNDKPMKRITNTIAKTEKKTQNQYYSQYRTKYPKPKKKGKKSSLKIYFLLTLARLERQRIK